MKQDDDLFIVAMFVTGMAIGVIITIVVTVMCKIN
jgi:hypothetical protein